MEEIDSDGEVAMGGRGKMEIKYVLADATSLYDVIDLQGPQPLVTLYRLRYEIGVAHGEAVRFLIVSQEPLRESTHAIPAEFMHLRHSFIHSLSKMAKELPLLHRGIDDTTRLLADELAPLEAPIPLNRRSPRYEAESSDRLVRIDDDLVLMSTIANQVIYCGYTVAHSNLIGIICWDADLGAVRLLARQEDRNGQ